MTFPVSSPPRTTRRHALSYASGTSTTRRQCDPGPRREGLVEYPSSMGKEERLWMEDVLGTPVH